MRGVLIAIEGIDGAGKTTQARMLAQALEAVGLEVVLTKEPTNGRWGRLLRASAATGRLSPAEELDAFLRDRAEHVSGLVGPSLAAGKVVIVDRYYFSTAAYQGIRGFDAHELLSRNEAFAPVPDVVLLLDVDPAAAVDRIIARDGKANEFERVELLTQIRAVFKRLDRSCLVTLDASVGIDALHVAVWSAVFDGPLFRALCRRTDGLAACAPTFCPLRDGCELLALNARRQPHGPTAAAAATLDVLNDPTIPDGDKAAALLARLKALGPS